MTTSSQLGSGGYPEKSRAAVVLTLGILGIAASGIFGPFAWAMGNRELAGIDAGRRAPGNRGIAEAGRILGIVGSVLIAGAVVLFGAAFVGIINVT